MRSLLQHLPVAAAEFNADGRVRWVNCFAASITGIDDPVGHFADEFFHANGPATSELVRETLASGKPLKRLRAGVTAAGHYVVVQATQFPLDDGHVLGVSVDVTADLRLAAQRGMIGSPVESRAAPKTSEAFLRLVLEGATVAEICAALELSADEVYAKLARLIG